VTAAEFGLTQVCLDFSSDSVAASNRYISDDLEHLRAGIEKRANND